MKAKDILEWVVMENIEGEYLHFLDVPEAGDNGWEQNKEWWIDNMDGCPPSPIESGCYLLYYQSLICDTIFCGGAYHVPDAQIEIPTNSGFDYIYLYKVED